MSGHNKWSKIKHKKAITDKVKGQNFTKIAKMIKISARKGTDPQTNSELRLSLEKAKEVNMPKENIQRILDKADKNDGQEILYEAFGNDGIGLLIKAYTDNVNRTVAEIRHSLTKNGGSLGNPGTVMWMFEELVYLNDYKSKIPVELNQESMDKLSILIDALDELDDVENIWHNAK